MRIAGGMLVALLCVCQHSRADDKLNAAREHYRAGTAAYELGQFDEAIKEFTEAYKLKSDPTILYNIAQANRLADHKADALREYRMYLMKVPDAPNRAEVEQRIAELEKASLEGPDEEVARRLFQTGAAHYDKQEYREAITDFERAKKIKPTALLGFNIARAYDRMGQFADAVRFYRQYVSAKPEPADAAEVRARIDVLEKRLAPAPAPTSATPAAVQLETSAPPPAETHKRKAWVVPVAIVAAVVVVGAAVGLGVGLSVHTNEVDPTPAFGAVHWQ